MRITIVRSVTLLIVLVVAASATAWTQMISPELLFRITTASPLELEATAIDGSTIDLKKMRGKVVLLDFWAIWCGPCLKEIPNVKAVYTKFHERGFEIIGISLDENSEALARFTKAQGMSWPQYLDENKKVSQRFEIDGVPTMWLLNKQGVIANLNARTDLAGSVEKLLAQ